MDTNEHYIPLLGPLDDETHEKGSHDEHLAQTTGGTSSAGYRLYQKSIWLVRLQFAVIIVLFLGMLLAINQPKSQCFDTTQLLYSPALTEVSYELKMFSAGNVTTNVYMGEPSQELDSAWNALYNNIGVSQIEHSQAQVLRYSPDPMPVDPQYSIIELAVFHQLHCLNMIRKALHVDVYVDTYPDGINWSHVDHCVEALRQAILCASDVTPIPWQSQPGTNKFASNLDIEHTCRNFDKIADWARVHQIEERFAEFIV